MIQSDGLRPIVEAVAREMSRLRERALASDVDAAALFSSWDRLVAFLALGPAPELKACPFCGSEGMRAATRCGVCWSDFDAR